MKSRSDFEGYQLALSKWAEGQNSAHDILRLLSEVDSKLAFWCVCQLAKETTVVVLGDRQVWEEALQSVESYLLGAEYDNSQFKRLKKIREERRQFENFPRLSGIYRALHKLSFVAQRGYSWGWCDSYDALEGLTTSFAASAYGKSTLTAKEEFSRKLVKVAAGIINSAPTTLRNNKA